VFDGGYMLGERGKKLGLIDGFGDVDTLVKELGGPKAKPYWLRPKRQRGLLRLITRSAVSAVLDVAEEKLLTPTLR
jgi:ClpP class serine protease